MREWDIAWGSATIPMINTKWTSSRLSPLSMEFIIRCSPYSIQKHQDCITLPALSARFSMPVPPHFSLANPSGIGYVLSTYVYLHTYIPTRTDILGWINSRTSSPPSSSNIRIIFRLAVEQRNANKLHLPPRWEAAKYREIKPISIPTTLLQYTGSTNNLSNSLINEKLLSRPSLTGLYQKVYLIYILKGGDSRCTFLFIYFFFNLLKARKKIINSGTILLFKIHQFLSHCKRSAPMALIG